MRRRIVSFFYPCGRSPSHDFSIDYHGSTYVGDIATAQDWHVFFFGGYELREIALIRDILGFLQDAVAVDVGANLGGHTMAMAGVAKSVFSFEPYYPLASQIRKRLELNHISNVELHIVGLGAKDGEEDYYFDVHSSNSGTGSFLEDHTKAPVVEKLQIRAGDGVFFGGAIDLVKIDIEGYEANALQGLRRTLLDFHPAIVMEVTETSASLFAQKGGIKKVIPYEFSIFEICNPVYHFGFFQDSLFSLKKLDVVVPRASGFNVLVLPARRDDLIVHLQEYVKG